MDLEGKGRGRGEWGKIRMGLRKHNVGRIEAEMADRRRLEEGWKKVGGGGECMRS